MVRSLRVFLLSFVIFIITTINLWATNPTTASPEIFIRTRIADEPGLYKAIVWMINNPGIAGYSLAMEFDSAMLTPVSITEGDALSGMVFISNVTGATEEAIAEMSAVTAVWASAEDDVGNGVLYTILFHASPIISDTAELRLISRGIGNANEQNVDFILTGAIIDFREVGLSNMLAQEDAHSINVTLLIIYLLIVIIIALAIFIVAICYKRQNSQHKKPNIEYRRLRK